MPTAKYGDYAAWRKDDEHAEGMLGEEIDDLTSERIESLSRDFLDVELMS